MMAGPMEGIKVVELGVWVAGPAAGGILADWGADVVKIEPPNGDPARMFGRMLGIEDGVSPPFEMDNRGKRSIVLDLTTDDGRAATYELLDDAEFSSPTSAQEPCSARSGFRNGGDTKSPAGVRPDHRVRRERARRRPRGLRRRGVLGTGGLAHLLTRPGETPPFQRGGMGDHMAGMTFAGGGLCGPA